jgi:hypothetical protein
MNTRKKTDMPLFSSCFVPLLPSSVSVPFFSPRKKDKEEEGQNDKRPEKQKGEKDIFSFFVVSWRC